MPDSADGLGRLLRDFDLRALLVEGLGWNHYNASLAPIGVDAHEYTFEPVAEKAGVAVYVCSPGPGGAIPPYAARRKIERKVADLAFEHLIVFADARRRTQVWQWVKRESGARDVCREQWFRRGLSGESLLQSLRGMAFSLEEEATVDAVEVASRVRAAFDVETLYSRFTEGFRRRTVAPEEADRPIAAPASAAETAFTAELANALRGKHPRWTDRIDRIDALNRQAGQYPGIIVRHPGGAPVVVSTGFGPASAAEEAARDSVGALVEGASGDGIDAWVEQAIVVRVPDDLRATGASGERMDEAEFQYCVLTQAEDEPRRWPESGWLSGGIDDLAGLIEQTALSERLITDGMRILEEGVSQAAKRLCVALKDDRPDALERIADALHQEDGEQTSRMAMTIVANALTVHSVIAEEHEIATVAALRRDTGQLGKDRVLQAWTEILKVNYYPIFEIARQVLVPIPERVASELLERLHAVASDLALIGATSTQDLAGQMFGRLITDRKFLATFYTLPSSAALLAELAVSKLDVDWGDAEAVKALRIADLACGTGVLLSAAYRAVAARHRRSGGDDGALHEAMMENALVGADIMPAATHLTASMLSSAHPTVTFGNTQIHTMHYGSLDEGSGDAIAIGSLDLIESDRMPGLFRTGPRIVSGKGGDKQAEGFEELVLPGTSVDLVIMNPPFTRATNHERADVPVPSFAGFATNDEEQRRMAAALKDVRTRLAEPAGNGNAGLASNFIDLAHQKLKPGGVLALVLPLTIALGGSWSAARRLLARDYYGVTVITLSTTGQHDRAFSADTGMGEALVVAVKRGKPTEAKPMGERTDGVQHEADCQEEGRPEVEPTLYVNLLRRPDSAVSATEIGRTIVRLPDEDAGFVRSGDSEAGCYIRATMADGGCTSLREPYAAAAAIGLRGGELHLPWQQDSPRIAMTALAELGERGLLHRDIAGGEPSGGGVPRGPFDVGPQPEPAAKYPMLWGHDAERERRLVVQPDSEGLVRPGQDERAARVWDTATCLHFNLDFQLNSQSLAACLTPNPAIGGRAWPNVRVEGDPRHEKALALWANTTLGLICFWWVAGRQQQGRAILTITGLPSLPVLDVRTFDSRQLRLADETFASFRDWRFLPANEAYRDGTRQALDRAVLCDLLRLPESMLEPLAVLREQWCAEPTVHGGKSTRPGGGG